MVIYSETSLKWPLKNIDKTKVLKLWHGSLMQGAFCNTFDLH